MSLSLLRYMTFEIGRDCPLAKIHPKCPISHPDRYLYGKREISLTDETILGFWKFCRYELGFRGIILWHWLNEPTLHIERIRYLMRCIRKIDQHQPFQITTYSPSIDLADFDIVKRSNYDLGVFHDNRIETVTGNGKPYSELPANMKRGLCGRGMGWELLIDNWGNWCLCCNDFRCEEAIGNINVDDWDVLYCRWNEKRRMIQWHNEHEYNRLPRMCRACLDVNPELHSRGGV